MTRLKLLGCIAAAAFCAAPPSRAETVINGAGATFPNPVYRKWFAEYQKLHPEVQINYQPLGSGAGIKQLTEGRVDFGATDGPLSDSELAAFRTRRGTDVLHFPTVLGAVAITYNLPGVTTPLNLTADTAAGIFLGKIKNWNDPAIAKANRQVQLPSAEIVVVHRSEGSGTTYCFTDYLSKVSPQWKSGIGRGTSVQWPEGQLRARGNEGVSALVKQTRNAIGYVELAYALENRIPYASVQNGSGLFIAPTPQSITAAAAGVVTAMPGDFRVSITNAAGKHAYPISTFTWLLVPTKQSYPGKSAILADFLEWMLVEGQAMTTGLPYAPLPPELVGMERRAISKIQ